VRVLKAAEGEVLDLAFSPDGNAVAAAFPYNVYLWNLEAAPPVPVKLVVEDGCCRGGLHFSANGRSLSWRMNGGHRVYDRDHREYSDHSFAITRATPGVIRSADGLRVVSQHGLPDHCLIGWRTADRDWIRTWTVSTADMDAQSLTLSDDGRLFAMLTRSALGHRWWDHPLRVEIRDATTAKILAIAEYPSNQPARLMLSPSGSQLVGFKDMTLLVWPIPTELGSPNQSPAQLQQLGSPQLIRNDNRKHFTALAYHPSGRHLYAASNDTTVHIFDTQTWERAGRFTWQLGNLKAVTVSPDGTLAAAGSDRGDVVIWDVDV
jgi:WD40 repeat protein